MPLPVQDSTGRGIFQYYIGSGRPIYPSFTKQDGRIHKIG